MTYPDYKKVYLDKSMTLEQWREKDKIRAAAEKEKIKEQEARGADIIRRLANGEKVTPNRLINGGDTVKIVADSLNIKNISPRKIGQLTDISVDTLNQEILKYEKLIARAKIENAVIFTATGAIYHCTGELNGIDTILEIGEKLNGATVTHNHPDDSNNEYSFSEADVTLFRSYNLKRLRGIDQKYIYEFNRNLRDIEAPIPFSHLHEYNSWHSQIILIAKSNGWGYRRQERE